jgi:hypothetical protein
MTRAQLHRIRWPVLLISRKSSFFHVAADEAEPLRHALDDIAQWTGPGPLRLGRAARRFAGIDIVDSARRPLRLVTGPAGVSVRPRPDREPVAEDVLLGRISAALELLAATAATIPGLAAETIPAPADGFAAYLARLGPILQSSHDEHVPAAAGFGAGHAGARFAVAHPAVAHPVRVDPAVAQPAVAQPAGVHPADLPLIGVHPVGHPRGWFHNLMHQAWG